MTASEAAHPLTVGVIGATGYTGSHLTVELLRRGHKVVGYGRNPEKLGTHKNYVPYVLDLSEADVLQIAGAFDGVDVLIDSFGPHSEGADNMLYKPFLEISRKTILAVRHAKVPYMLKIGGTGSLLIPGTKYSNAVDSQEFWTAYRRGIADSEGYVYHMEERFGEIGKAFRKYRNARILEREGKATPESRAVIEAFEAVPVKNDPAKDFITACRTSFEFFDGKTDFNWTFLSPSALYRSGVRTGKYETTVDYLPVKGDTTDGTELTGRLLGISASDLAVGVADEVENKQFKWKHWSIYADTSDESHVSSYVTLADV